jgi:glycosyltransferase involved in cell wall biosynthesis
MPNVVFQDVRIVHVSALDRLGGAARSAYRLHQGLLKSGFESSMFVGYASASEPGITPLALSGNMWGRLRRAWRRRRIARDFGRYGSSRPGGYEPFQDSRSPHYPDFLRELPQAEILHFHWIANGFVDYEEVFGKLPKGIPIVWTLHDMNPITGGCHYDLGCGRYREQCGSCPQLGSKDGRDLSHKVWCRKKRAYDSLAGNPLILVSPSRWLAGEVKRSSLARGLRTVVIPYGLDLDAFAPRNQAEARSVLGIPAEARVVLFLADSLDNERKGFRYLVEALEGLSDSTRLMLLSLGRTTRPLRVGVPCTHLGFVDNDRLLSLIYSAADIFVIPSLQDNLANTVLEALACGTPVIGFDVGGMSEMVRAGQSGTLVPAGNVMALRACIATLLANPKQLAEWSAHCRRIAVEEYGMELQARRYADLYKNLIAESLATGSSGRNSLNTAFS